jgi:hypothetical protein
MLFRVVAGGLLCASLGSQWSPAAALEGVRIQGAPHSADQLIAQFKQAHQTRAIASILGLVYWSTAGREMHQTMERSIAADFGRVIERITFQPLATETLEYTRRGVTYRPTLRPIGRLQVEFRPQPGKGPEVRSSSYLVGVKDGIYFLLTAAPVPR